jgi:hypothetical protein
LITSQPKNETVTIGSDVKFSAGVNDTASKFTWETDFDLGLAALPTVSSKYVGANTKELNVKSVSLRNHKQAFRVIAFTNVCIDTSNTVSLTIADTCVETKSVTVTDTLMVKFSVKVNSISKNQLVKVYPNPAQDQLTIDVSNLTDLNGYTVKVYNSLGAEVYTQNISQQVYTVDLKSWSSLGVYRMEILDKQGARVATKSIILN